MAMGADGGFDFSLDGGQSTVSYQPYPEDRPFIKDSYRRDVTKPLKSYPESNRQAVMSALHGLQEKIQQLELNRKSAAQGLHSVTEETAKIQARLQQASPAPIDTSDLVLSPRVPDPTGRSKPVGLSPRLATRQPPAPTTETPKPTGMSIDTQELESQLTAAEGRCTLLERQLEYMRRMVSSDASPHRTSARGSPRPSPREEDQMSYRDKLCDLEREHLKLSATQSVAENKIKELESRLEDERDCRQRIQQRAAELETATQMQRITHHSAPRPSSVPRAASRPTSARSKKPAKRKSAHRVPSRHSRNKCTQIKSNSCEQRGVPMDHYRLNLKEIPFVVGQSTGPSHSVNANLQRVLAMMKTHNDQLCTAAKRGQIYSKKLSSGRRSRAQTSPVDLDELLQQLQDEFATLSFEHQELIGQLQESRDPAIRDDLERELDELVGRMQTKASQISQLKYHQTKERKRRRRADSARQAPPPVSVSHATQSSSPSAVHHHSAAGGRDRAVASRSTQSAVSGGSARDKQSLQVLKEMKTLQNSLRVRDVQWQ